MLISFAVENYKSIRDRQVFSLEATSDDHLAESRVVETDGLRILRSAAVYGPNASGKSNLISAIIGMRQIILAAPPRTEDQMIPVEPFRLRPLPHKHPTSFECHFLLDGLRYRYGFTADRERVHEEWLMRKHHGHKEASLFTREGQEITVNPEQFKEGVDKKSYVHRNTFFLPLCAQLAGETASKVVNWFRRLRYITGLSDSGYFFFTAKRMQEPNYRERLIRFAQLADFNITDLSSKLGDPTEVKLPDSVSDEARQRLLEDIMMANTEIKARHLVFDEKGKEHGTVEFDLKREESEGTRKFVALSGPLHHTAEDQAVLLVDEFEARLHPLLTQQIIDWFHSPQNPGRAQLILATHDVLLMEPDRIRRDQVWFCQKNATAATNLYCLAEFDPQQVRHTTKFSRQYLLGLFGAIPKLALLEGEKADA